MEKTSRSSALSAEGRYGTSSISMRLVPCGIDTLSNIHHLATDFDRVEHAGNSNNPGTRAPGGHHALVLF
ncbi:hypothetical protein [Rhizobacter sp. Root29]|uniref:hypothetical protein n=1 Tax=Rhizobacter sp. Root29 TaxID=1736511 RepID=UPI00138F40DB|nr:hypothetical protein [Rhizobacter sp. Root29]